MICHDLPLCPEFCGSSSQFKLGVRQVVAKVIDIRTEEQKFSFLTERRASWRQKT